MKDEKKRSGFGKLPKELVADIRIFDVLLIYATEKKISFTAWARAAWPEAQTNQQPRISELKRISELVKGGLTQEEASDRVKRLCTLPKILALEEGLMRIDVVSRKQMNKDCYDIAKQQGKGNKAAERATLHHFLFNQLTEKKQDQANRYLGKLAGVRG